MEIQRSKKTLLADAFLPSINTNKDNFKIIIRALITRAVKTDFHQGALGVGSLNGLISDNEMIN